MPSREKENFGMIQNGRSYLHVCVHFFARFTELVPRRDMRQNFLVEDLVEHFDDGALCGASVFLDRGAECSCLLQDLHRVFNSRAIETHTSTEVCYSIARPNIEKD